MIGKGKAFFSDGHVIYSIVQHCSMRLTRLPAATRLTSRDSRIWARPVGKARRLGLLAAAGVTALLALSPMAAAWTISTYDFNHSPYSDGLGGSASGSGCGPAACGPTGSGCSPYTLAGTVLATHTVATIDSSAGAFCVNVNQGTTTGAGNASQNGYVDGYTQIFTWLPPNSTTGLVVTASGVFYDSIGYAVVTDGSTCGAIAATENGRAYLQAQFILTDVTTGATVFVSPFTTVYDTKAQSCLSNGGPFFVGDPALTNIPFTITERNVALTTGNQYWVGMLISCQVNANAAYAGTSIVSYCEIPGAYNANTYVDLNSVSIT